MVNIEDKSCKFQLWRLHWKWQSTQFLWNESPYIIAVFLVNEAAEFPIVLAIWHLKCLLQCNVGWDKMGKLLFVEMCMPLNLAMLMNLFSENDKRTIRNNNKTKLPVWFKFYLTFLTNKHMNL